MKQKYIYLIMEMLPDGKSVIMSETAYPTEESAYMALNLYVDAWGINNSDYHLYVQSFPLYNHRDEPAKNKKLVP